MLCIERRGWSSRTSSNLKSLLSLGIICVIEHTDQLKTFRVIPSNCWQFLSRPCTFSCFTSTSCSEPFSWFPVCDEFSWLDSRGPVISFSSSRSWLSQSSIISSFWMWLSELMVLQSIWSSGNHSAIFPSPAFVDTTSALFSLFRTFNAFLLLAYLINKATWLRLSSFFPVCTCVTYQQFESKARRWA